MSRSRAIDTRLEKLTPSLDEYLSTGFMEREEVVELSRRRKHWEYRLVAKPLLLLDVQHAIEYELQIEEKLQNYCAATKLNFRHRWAVLERIEGLYRIGLKNLRVPAEKEVIRKECVKFMKKFGRVAALSKLYGEWMMLSPTRSDLWIEAAEWTAIEQKNVEDGRALIQQALVTMAAEPAVWASAVKIELHMVRRLLRGLLDSHRTEIKREWEKNNEANGVDPSNAGSIDYEFHTIAPRLRAENESMASILLDLGLVKAVIEEAMDSPACGPALFHSLIHTSAAFSVAGDIVRLLSKEGVERCFQAIGDSKQPQQIRMKWEDGAAALVWDYLSIEHFVSNHGPSSLLTPIEFLERGGASDIPPRTQRVHTAGLTLISTCAAVQAFYDDEQCSAVTANRFFSVKGLRTTLADGVSEVLSFLQRNGVEDEVVSSIASRLLASDLEKSEPVTAHIARKLLKETGKGKKVPKQSTEEVKAIALAQQLVSDVCTISVAPPKQKVRRDSAVGVTLADFWPASCFSKFILAEDGCSTDISLLVQSCETLDDETVDRLLLWWKSLDRLDNDESNAPEDSSSKKWIKKSVTNTKEQRRQVVVELFRKLNLIPSSASGLKRSAVPVENVDLLARRNMISYTSGKTPITLWKVYNALEVILGEDSEKGVTGSLSSNSVSSSSSSSDEDEQVSKKLPARLSQKVSCYSAAGLEFLSSVVHGSLNHKEEWLSTEGVCALLRSRFYSLSGKARFTREEMREVIRSKVSTGFVRQVQAFLDEASRCKPRPRYALTSLLIPFYEALVLEVPTARNVAAARSLYEELLSLYGLTKHLDHFAPLLFDGSSTSAPSCRKDLPRELNAKDWLAYVHFERFVSKDLTRAQQVMERARRLCLAPQQLLIANHSNVPDFSNGTDESKTSFLFYESC